MRWPERLCGFGVGAVVPLCMALVGATQQASAAPAEALTVQASAMPAHRTSEMADGLPCARCCAAPTPAVQGVGGEPAESRAPGWRLQAARTPDATWFIDVASWPARLPARIAYCRWLN